MKVCKLSAAVKKMRGKERTFSKIVGRSQLFGGKKLVTGDESWNFQYYPETECQSLQ
jgi:hypothetical protein